ncbi:MAG: SDR family NAD(P)-dependent oxidoreductase [Desulfomonile tiedjei]|uniref:SDR family NAD(P)-dependent oxidoreductase n=1 Tax=Desulfomonile tiedjei TaxID=2358 RepID=A0A9D6V4X7_9BACT|nr:SDR family NAD(P)-dependent oxidoreductase [Desulfomonile tiedjei]
MVDPKSVLITGASGGIGSALAKAYAKPDRHLFLGDVDSDKLARVCDICNELGAVSHGHEVDVTNREAMENWIAEADGTAALDLVIANAGISHGNLRREETEEQIRAVFAVNLEGTLNTVLPALPMFRTRKRGQIAIMGSMAGVRGFPHAPSYCASKAAIRVFGQGLRARVRREGVSVCVIIPAFVQTPMTEANAYGMPWRLGADEAARIIKHKLLQDKGEFVFPYQYAFAAWLASAIPSSIMSFLTRLK